MSVENHKIQLFIQNNGLKKLREHCVTHDHDADAKFRRDPHFYKSANLLRKCEVKANYGRSHQ